MMMAAIVVFQARRRRIDDRPLAALMAARYKRAGILAWPPPAVTPPLILGPARAMSPAAEIGSLLFYRFYLLHARDALFIFRTDVDIY